MYVLFYFNLQVMRNVKKERLYIYYNYNKRGGLMLLNFLYDYCDKSTQVK